MVRQGMTQEDIRKARKKKQKKLIQEEVHDDCGSDLGPIEQKALLCEFACCGSLESAVSYSFMDGEAFASDSAETYGEMEDVLQDNYWLRYL